MSILELLENICDPEIPSTIIRAKSGEVARTKIDKEYHKFSEDVQLEKCDEAEVTGLGSN